MKRIILMLIMPALLTQALIAEDNRETKISSSNEILLQISTLPELKLGFTKRFVFPFLQGEGPLTEDNNIDLALTAEISPVSLNGLAEAVWTPIAFFQLAAGGKIGSGWNLELFGNKIYGIGLTYSDDTGKVLQSGNAFDGLQIKAQMGATLQADLTAIVPGEWNHVVVRSYHEVNFKAYTRAAAGESWYLESDDGENINGFNYYGNFLLGYQMPIFLDLAALLVEGDLYLYDTPNRTQWGDDKIRWTFSNILNFAINKQFSIALITQFRTRRNYNEQNWEDLYYRHRTINDSKPIGFEFYRVAAAVTYKF
ncbi:hypothetical protein FACS189485_11800 [Spirochaetia bacterium]|nr:hypothetical protein FACS189485_11800 [Spirochaetia bacterium]